VASTARVYSKGAALAAFGDSVRGMTDEDWERLGNKIELPGPEPGMPEQIAEVFPARAP